MDLRSRVQRSRRCGLPASLGALGKSGPQASVSSFATRDEGHRFLPAGSSGMERNGASCLAHTQRLINVCC